MTEAVILSNRVLIGLPFVSPRLILCPRRMPKNCPSHPSQAHLLCLLYPCYFPPPLSPFPTPFVILPSLPELESIPGFLRVCLRLYVHLTFPPARSSLCSHVAYLHPSSLSPTLISPPPTSLPTLPTPQDIAARIFLESQAGPRTAVAVIAANGSVASAKLRDPSGAVDCTITHEVRRSE